ncbi:MAG: mevalonate kinase family protein [Candidatus Hodarchaeales archaeon]
MSNDKEVTVKAPARVVLFGEHQDYLGLPVIPAAVNIHMTIKGHVYNAGRFRVEMSDLRKQDIFYSDRIAYLGDRDRDYLRAGVKVLQEENIVPRGKGVLASITSEIPIQAGLSSSSALNVAWIKFLSELFGHSLTSMELTKLAHKSEVLEFNEPGGMQDHMAIAHGYINFEEFDPVKCTRLQKDLAGIVVGNSKERKDTLNTLASIKAGVFKTLDIIGKSKVREVSVTELEGLNSDQLDSFSLNALRAAVINHELTRQAHHEFRKKSIDHELIGKLINDHHACLRDYLNISTPKIEKMINNALAAGALGCKITGSGNGGCMIAYCPGKEFNVKKAIEKSGSEAFIVSIARGVHKV